MADSIVITEITNKNSGFYGVMGPFLARRTIARELGSPLWDEDERTWFVALRGGEVLGFGAVRPRGNHLYFCSGYVRPEFRAQGIGKKLLEVRLAHACTLGLPAQATVTPDALPLYEKEGFLRLKEMKNYVIVQRSI